MSETHGVADPHFFHKNIILHCGREKWTYDNPDFDPSKPEHFRFNNPKAVHLKQHDDDMISYWNGVVSKHDKVWILGDLAWKNHAHYIMALNGTKYLVRGNHDKMSLEALRLFAKMDGTHHYHFSYYTQIHGRRIMMSHCPYATWFSSGHDSWNLHGHCHGRYHEQPYLLQFDCGVDIWGYRPVPWCVIEKKMADKERIKKEYMAMSPDDRLKNFELPPEREESEDHVIRVRNKNMEYLKSVGIEYTY